MASNSVPDGNWVNSVETVTTVTEVSWRETPGGVFVDYALPYLIILIIFVVMILVLRFAYGRVWWCKCGKARPWSGEIKSMHNSQHVADPYTFSHFLHGVLFFWCVYFIPEITIHHKAAIVFVTAVMWELIENTGWVVKRYRENTTSYGYEGDSVVNSVSDCVFCMLGFLFSFWHSWYVCLIVGILDEAMLAYWIRDNMIINAIMLVHKFSAIDKWQAELEKRRGSTAQTGSEENEDAGADQADGGPSNGRPGVSNGEKDPRELATFIDNSV